MNDVRRILGVTGLLALTACVDAPPVSTPTVSTRPETRVAVPSPVTPKPPSAESLALATYYARLQNDRLAQGLLRGDGGGPDTPFTDTMLARNFVRIALFDEFRNFNGTLEARPTASRLSRWDQPVRMAVEFGASVPETQRRQDGANVAAYARRLSRATRHPITMTESAPNFHVMFYGLDDREQARARLQQLVPEMGPGALNAILSPPRDQLCVVVAFSEPGSASYAKAIAVIRAEHPPLFRTSCIHEELAQGLGLANDSPQARPSIFNDDDEFGLLTRHDELLLQMLYDPRLRTGMSASEAAPIARRIATELVGGGSS